MGTTSDTRRSLRITLLAVGTPFLDGFSTASAAFLISLVPGLSALEVALFTSLFLLGSFVGAFAVAPLGDRLGRRPVFLASVFSVFALAALAAAVPAVSVLLFMRFLTGVAAGADYPAGQALVTEHVNEHYLTRALSALMLAWYAGAIAGVLAAVPALRWDADWRGMLVF